MRFICVVGVSMLDIDDIVDDDREHNVGEEEEEEEEDQKKNGSWYRDLQDDVGRNSDTFVQFIIP